MELIIWDDSLSVGVKAMDAQHKKLIKIINDLNENILHDYDGVAFEKILDELVNYIDYHFKCEEDLFVENGFEKSESHIKMHKYFTNQVLQYKYLYDSGKKPEATELMKLLRYWLIEHIIKTDKTYGKFLNEKGIF